MAAPTAYRYGWLVEGMLLVVSIAWVGMPLAILGAQMIQGVHLEALERACFLLGGVGLILTAAVNAASVYQLRRLRQASR